MRPKLDWRAAVSGGALCLAYTCAGHRARRRASTRNPGHQPTATASTVAVSERRMNVRTAGALSSAARSSPPARPSRCRSAATAAGSTLDRDRTDARGAYVLRDRQRRPLSAQARVKVSGRSGGHRRIGRLNVYRHAHASWYGPGLYGGHRCGGGTLHAGDIGVAHKSLPCGTKVTLRHHGRVVRVPVIDRGPYVGGREYDLTEATARRLKFKGHGAIQSTR